MLLTNGTLLVATIMPIFFWSSSCLAETESINDYVKKSEKLCVNKESAKQSRSEYRLGDLFYDVDYNSYNLSKASLRGLLLHLQDIDRQSQQEAWLVSRYMRRGIVHTVLGNTFQAIGDFLTAKKHCETAPVAAWLALNYYNEGLIEEASSWAEQIACDKEREKFFESCTSKASLLLLLDRYEQMELLVQKSLATQDLLILTDFALSGETLTDSTLERIRNDKTGMSGARLALYGELSEFTAYLHRKYKTYDTLSYINMYYAIAAFALDKNDIGCKHSKKGLELKEENRNIMYIFLFVKKLYSKYCESQ